MSELDSTATNMGGDSTSSTVITASHPSSTTVEVKVKRVTAAAAASDVFEDGLILIYSFLTINEFIQATRTCLDWYQPWNKAIDNHSTKSSPLLRYAYQVDLSTFDRYLRFQSMLHSSAGTFISSIPRSQDGGARIVDLPEITAALPHLTECALNAAVPQRRLPLDSLVLTRETRIDFPRHLLALTIDCQFVSSSRSMQYPQYSFWQHLFNTICDQARELRKLIWTVVQTNRTFVGDEPDLDVSGLFKLTRLTDLEASFSGHQDQYGYELIVHLPLKRWVSLGSNNGTRSHWARFHKDSALMTHLQDWTIRKAGFTPEDYLHLASSASTLTRLDLQPQYESNLRGLQHLAALSNLRELKLTGIENPDGLSQLVALRSLTLYAAPFHGEGWLYLFSKLTQLQELNLIRCNLPDQLFFCTTPLCQRITIQQASFIMDWFHALRQCQCSRLQELSLIDITGDVLCTEVRHVLTEICASPTNSLRWVEVRNLRIRSNTSNTQTFILDSSKTIAQPSTQSLIDSRIDSNLIGAASPTKDLTRFGIEPNPGPAVSNRDSINHQIHTTINEIESERTMTTNPHTSPPPTSSTGHSRTLFDGIVLIYSFLTFPSELLIAGRIAHHWYQIIRDHISIATSGIRSPLMRHTYRPDDYPHFLTMLHPPARVLITSIPWTQSIVRIVDLQQITDSLTQLTILALDVFVSQFRGESGKLMISTHVCTVVEFPSHLTSLTIYASKSPLSLPDVECVYPPHSYFQHLFSSICNLATHLQTFVWSIRDYNHTYKTDEPDLDVSGLLKLTHLEGRFSVDHEYCYDTVVQSPLKSWKANPNISGTTFDWAVDHKDAPLMTHLESWTIEYAAFTPDDYLSLASNASGLTSLDFDSNHDSNSSLGGLRQLAACTQLRQLMIYSKDPSNEIIYITSLRSLTLVIQVGNWLNFCTTLNRLEERAIIEHMAISSAWVEQLSNCQRLHGLSLIGCHLRGDDDERSATQLRNKLKLICHSPQNSVKRVEVRDFDSNVMCSRYFIKSPFVLDSSKLTNARPHTPLLVDQSTLNDAQFRMVLPSVSDTAAAAPVKDLTRYGIEPHPGPKISNSTIVVSPSNEPTGIRKDHNHQIKPIIVAATSPVTLFKDGLLMIYSFLTLKEFIRATSVCHHWYQPILDATDQKPPPPLLRYTYEVDPSSEVGHEELLAMTKSSARLFVTRVPSALYLSYMAGDDPPQGLIGPRIVDLQQITAGLPFLTELALDRDQTDSGSLLTDETPLQFPCHLLSLTIHASLEWSPRPQPHVPRTVSVYQPLLNTICTQAPQLQKLVWMIGSYDGVKLDLSCLLQLRYLSDISESFFGDCLNDTFGGDIFVSLRLKRLMVYLPNTHAFDWSLFNVSTPLMTHLQDWTLCQSNFVREDYESLASNAPFLTCLSLYSTPLEGLGALSRCVRLRQLKLSDSLYILVDELSQLVGLRSLTLTRPYPRIEIESWLTLFTTLTQLIEFELIAGNFPPQILSACPTRTTLRRPPQPLDAFLSDELFKCARLQELILIGEMSASITTFQPTLRAICACPRTTLRRIEITLLTQPTRQTFIVDGSKSLATGLTPLRLNGPTLAAALNPTSASLDASIGSPAPMNDLTRYGIEPHPGPTDITIDVNRDHGTSGATSTPENAVEHFPPITPYTYTSPGGRLFKDGLFTIYSFLTMKEFIRATSVSHHWYQPILNQSTQPNSKSPVLLQYTYHGDVSDIVHLNELLSMLQSPARWFVTSVQPVYLEMSGTTCKFDPKLDDFHAMVDCLPQLTSWTVDLRHLQPPDAHLNQEVIMRWPINLISLVIDFNIGFFLEPIDEPEVCFLQQVFDSVCNQAIHLERLVWLAYPYPRRRQYQPELDVSGLLNLKYLIDLEHRFGQSNDTIGHKILVQLPLKRWKSHAPSCRATKFDWATFHSHTPLMTHIEDWTLGDGALTTQDDFMKLAQHAPALTSLQLILNSNSVTASAFKDGLRHLSQVKNLRHCSLDRCLDSIEDTFSEMCLLAQLQSLTLKSISNLAAEQWKNLFDALIQLERLELDGCQFPIEIVPHFPTRTILRYKPVPPRLTHFLHACHRLRELSLICFNADGLPPDHTFKEALNQVCQSNDNSLRRIEVVNLFSRLEDDLVCQNFIFDSPGDAFRREEFEQQPDSSTTTHTYSRMMDQPLVGDRPIEKDLTRYGIEPHPGPTSDESIMMINTESTPIGGNDATPMVIPDTCRLITVSTSPSTLFKDGLLIIYSFLSLKEFIRARCVSQHWYQPILNQKKHPTTQGCPLLQYAYASLPFYRDEFLELWHSPARWFVTSLQPSYMDNDTHMFAPRLVDYDAMVDCLPQLTNLVVDVGHLQPLKGEPLPIMRWPIHLSSLTIHLTPTRMYPEYNFLQRVFDSVCDQAALLEKLVWDAAPNFDNQNYQRRPELNVSGLLKLTHLTDLTNRFSERDDTVGNEILVQLRLKRWKSIPVASASTKLNWTIFQPLMTHLEDWTLYDGAIRVAEDYHNLVLYTPGLTSLALLRTTGVTADSFEGGLRQLSQLNKLRHLLLSRCPELFISVAFTEMSHLVQLRSLSLKSMTCLVYDTWKMLFDGLSQLERFELDQCIFPIEIVPLFPTSAILREMCVSPRLTQLLPRCHRLRELSLIRLSYEEESFDTFRNALNQICQSNVTSLRRIEVIDLFTRNCDIPESFIFDSPSKGFVQEKDRPIQRLFTINTDTLLAGNDCVGEGPREEDLTRYGIEPNPGPPVDGRMNGASRVDHEQVNAQTINVINVNDTAAAATSSSISLTTTASSELAPNLTFIENHFNCLPLVLLLHLTTSFLADSEVFQLAYTSTRTLLDLRSRYPLKQVFTLCHLRRLLQPVTHSHLGCLSIGCMKRWIIRESITDWIPWVTKLQQQSNQQHSISHVFFGDGFNESVEGFLLPSSVTHLQFGSKFSHPSIASFTFPPSLTYLEFGPHFSQDLSSLFHLPTTCLRVLKFAPYHTDFDSPYGEVVQHELSGSLMSLPWNDMTQLIEIHLFIPTNPFTQAELEAVLSPLVNLTTLSIYLDDCYDLPNYHFPKQIKHITIHDFVGSIVKLSAMLPDELTHLSFGPNFNLPLDEFIFPPQLLYLSLGRYWGPQPCSFKEWKLPATLTHLHFDIECSWECPLRDLRLPASCTQFDLPASFNQPMSNVSSSSLTCLELFYCYNQPLHDIEWPESLTRFDLGSNAYNYPLHKLRLPKNLIDLRLRTLKPLTEPFEFLCPNLRSFALHFGSNPDENAQLPTIIFPDTITGLLFSSYWDKQSWSHIRLPLQLRSLDLTFADFNHELECCISPDLTPNLTCLTLRLSGVNHLSEQSLAKIHFPSSLTSLDLNGEYLARADFHPPPSVHHLTIRCVYGGYVSPATLARLSTFTHLTYLAFEGAFNQSVDSMTVPPHLLSLNFRQSYFNHPLDGLIDHLPPCLIHLSLNSQYLHPLTGLTLERLPHLSFIGLPTHHNAGNHSQRLLIGQELMARFPRLIFDMTHR